MSEKLDGIRAYWDGKQLYSIEGIPFHSPSYFTENLPKEIELDGELWLGRNSLESLISQIYSKDKGNRDIWKRVKYMIFDTPNTEMVYETRIDKLKKLSLPSHVQVVETIQCRNRKHLKEFLYSIVQIGGEGLMMNRPNSTYVKGRSTSLLRVKVNLTTYNNNNKVF